MHPIKKIIADAQGSWIARSLILGTSFLAPFIWALSTDLIWIALKNISPYTTDASINISTATPLISIMTGTWIICACLLKYFVKSTLRTAIICNLCAVIAFIIELTLTLGTSDWNLVSGDLIRIFPLRFGLAVLLAFASSALACRLFKKAEAW